MIDDGFGHWFAGFMDGEGTLFIAHDRALDRYRCRAAIELRGDDASVLEEIQRRLGFGAIVQVPARRGGHPCVRWQLGSMLDVGALIDILERYPLRAKKARDLVIWREAAAAQRAGDWERMAVLRAELMASRAFCRPVAA